MAVVAATATRAAATCFGVVGHEAGHRHDGNQHTQDSFHFYQSSLRTGWLWLRPVNSSSGKIANLGGAGKNAGIFQ
jgi:hypothetical protein